MCVNHLNSDDNISVPVVHLKKISARDAVLAANNFYQKVSGSQNPGTLEEVENKGDGFWYITLGFSAVPLLPNEKKYRIFKVSEKDGNVESMKMRE